jgi:hypothetical protein
MELLASLCLAILVASVACFALSSIIWMVSPLHKRDHTGLPDEARVIEAIRASGVRPAVYMFPYASSMKEKSSPEYVAKWKAGPAGLLTVFRPFSMGVNMALTWLVFLVVSFGIGYLLSVTVARGAEGVRVFQVAATAGVLAYAFAQLPHQVWFQSSTSNKIASFVDGVLYGLVTGGVFALMWPG